QPADPLAKFGFWDGCDPVHHQAAGPLQTIALTGLHQKTKQRCFCWIGREGTDRDRDRGVETVILDDHGVARLADIVLAAGNCPDFSPSHPSPQSETVSMNA